MGVLDGLITGGGLQASTPGPADDFWYGAAGTMTAAGIKVDDEGARKLAAWYRGRELLASSLAQLPFNLYERLPNDAGAEVARGMPLYDVIHTKPNPWQNAFDWRRQKMYHLIDHGNAYDFIVEGARGFVDQLWPIHPSLVTPEQLDSRRVVYHVRDAKKATVRTYTQDEIFHLRGASDDGVIGKGVLRYARENIATALRVEGYAANIFGRGTLNGGWIKVPGVLDPEAGKRMAMSFLSRPGEEHVPKVMEQGAEFQPNELTPEDAQMLLSRQFAVTDIARWLGVPPHMIGDLARATFSNIEHQGQEFVTYSLGPWLSLFEFSVNDQLILNTSRFYAEFVREALVRGDLTSRSQADVAYVNAGIETVDEVRARNNRNKRGGKADELREPQNITGKAAVPVSPKPSSAPPDDAKAQAIVIESAARILRKEVKAIQRIAVQHPKSEPFAVAVTDFYRDHASLVQESLRMSVAEAEQYCAGQAAQALEFGVRVAENWATVDYAQGLAAWALGDA